MKLKLPSRRGWIFATLTSCVALSLPVFLQPDHLHEAWWNTIPGFFSGYGFIGCTLIILLSKWMGRLLLQKPTDFYDG
ncbi:MAG: hypothetical protein CL484_02690 [Acidobacteria bacterium]|nr:hypothetical protein [Acidobacteriota bacterium]|tara:strand:- start:1821 stop:2054 length:234 start_codon:yes stop_codon:yes gene_type:complete